MSLAKTKTTKAAKEYTCEKCRQAILKGESYISYEVGFRSRFVHRRHDLPGCRPRPSERESSKLADVYSAQEDAQDALAALTVDSEDLQSEIESILEELGSRIEEVQNEYDEAATDDNGTEWNTTAAERRDELESVVSEIQSFYVDESTTECDAEGCNDGTLEDGTPCGKCEGEGEVPDLEQMLSSAIAFVNELEVP